MLSEIFEDKTLKPKQKVEVVSKLLLKKSLSCDELVSFAKKSKDPVKASCIEAIEFATKSNPAIADEGVLDFATTSLKEKAPRIKWESAKVIGNIATRFPVQLDNAMKLLLINAKADGTVVRWSAAFALGEIYKLKSPLNKKLLPAIEKLISEEEKNSIRKIYKDALKSAG